MMRKSLTILLALGCTTFLVQPVLADEASDIEEINALMWHYARALDTLNEDAYVAVFTEDGAFGSGNTAAKGPDALRAMIVGVREGREQREADGEPAQGPMYHMTTDSWIEFIDEDHARHHSYWMTVFGPGEAGGGVNVAAVGRGIDDVVRVNGKWLISVRDVAPQD